MKQQASFLFFSLPFPHEDDDDYMFSLLTYRTTSFLTSIDDSHHHHLTKHVCSIQHQSSREASLCTRQRVAERNKITFESWLLFCRKLNETKAIENIILPPAHFFSCFIFLDLRSKKKLIMFACVFWYAGTLCFFVHDMM